MCKNAEFHRGFRLPLESMAVLLIGIPWRWLLWPLPGRIHRTLANLGYAVVVEAALSFLGVGTPPDVPSWGGMLSITGQKYIEVSPWLVVFPSLAVSLAVFGFNLLGDALRDALDPRLKGLQER